MLSPMEYTKEQMDAFVQEYRENKVFRDQVQAIIYSPEYFPWSRQDAIKAPKDKPQVASSGNDKA